MSSACPCGHYLKHTGKGGPPNWNGLCHLAELTLTHAPERQLDLLLREKAVPLAAGGAGQKAVPAMSSNGALTPCHPGESCSMYPHAFPTGIGYGFTATKSPWLEPSLSTISNSLSFSKIGHRASLGKMKKVP